MTTGRRQSIIASAVGGRFMHAQEFDPRMIILQILAIQSVFYFVFISSASFVSVLFGLSIKLSNFFDFSSYSFDNNSSGTLVAMLWFSLGVVAFLLPRIIERTRKCLDFVITIVVIHIVASWLVAGFPSSVTWWWIWLLGAAGCTLLGEWLCMREEQREIRLGSEDERAPAIELGKSSSDV